MPLGEEVHESLLVDDQVMTEVALYAIEAGVAKADTVVRMGGVVELDLPPHAAISNTTNKTPSKILERAAVLIDMMESSQQSLGSKSLITNRDRCTRNQIYRYGKEPSVVHFSTVME